MQLIHRFGHLIGGTLLVAGTSIGVGMLALPLATAQGGFFPSIFIYLLCWFFMLCTGLLILEVCSWCPKESNLVTMARMFLGKGGLVFCWVVYLFLFFCLMIAHVASGGNVVGSFAGGAVPEWLSVLIYVAIFSPVVYLGARSVDRVNLILMAGVLISYLLFIVKALPHIQGPLLGRANWPAAWTALPVVFTAFGYQSLIPTLYNYMDRDSKKVRKTIIAGTTIPLVIYLIWELLILGIVPVADLTDAMKLGQNAVQPLGAFLQNPAILDIGQAFAFFAMTTSYVGISIAFVDFLADGLKVQKKGIKKLALCGIVFGIPTIIVWMNPHVFMTALSYAGGFGVALLLGAMPVMMVWSGRYYHRHFLKQRQLPGGKAFLSLLMAFVLFELASQLV